MAVNTVMSILQIRKRRLGGFKPPGLSPKAEKWGFRPRLVSVQLLTVKNSGSQMKTWKYEGRPWPDIPHRHPDWPSALGNVAGLEGSAGPGRPAGLGGCSGADRPAGLCCPQPHCGQLAVEAGGLCSPGQRYPGPGFLGRTQLASPPAWPFLALFPFQASLSSAKSRDASVIPAETTKVT